MPFAPRDDPELQPDAIRAARELIHRAFVASPQYVHDGLSERAGRPVIVKVETVNPIGAFKGRGCWLAAHGLAGEGRVGPKRPLVVASTGNFGQGIAFAGRAAGVPVVVFADTHANPTKLERIRRFGATVVQAGEDFDEARAASEQHAAEHGAHLLVDGADPRVAAGAGTLAVEVTDAIAAGDLPAIGAAYVPVGNGALIVGVGAWLRHAARGARVVGVQSDAASSMTLSWRAGAVVETPRADTFADGIATRVPVPEALAMMVGRVDDMTLVSESALRDAQAELRAALGITVEGAAAASWAAALDDREADPELAALVIVTGSNVAD
ncbi:MAG TPA: pyridoxal-phosphate dependent enzyme [Candidatus Limnocylindrales bacterium]|nr:pyridoxal-phosphate dependent enzyme [Candidatus Limnocylindrales bacterium]